MTPNDYEKAVLECFRLAWPAPLFKVRHDVRLPGAKTGVDRQVDVAIFEVDRAAPIMLVEAKRHRRPVDAGIAGSTIAMVQDIGGIPTVMVSTTGFSIAAASHLAAEAIGHMTITLTEAMALRWIPTIEARFAVDRAFAEVSGELVEAIRNGDPVPFLDVDVPFEEWCAVVETGLSMFDMPTKSILATIASTHYDDAHRHNAVRMLIETEHMTPALFHQLFDRETDPDIIELLREHAPG